MISFTLKMLEERSGAILQDVPKLSCALLLGNSMQNKERYRSKMPVAQLITLAEFTTSLVGLALDDNLAQVYYSQHY